MKKVYEIQGFINKNWQRSAIMAMPRAAKCKTVAQWKELTLEMSRAGCLEYRLVTLNPVTLGVTKMVYAPRKILKSVPRSS